MKRKLQIANKGVPLSEMKEYNVPCKIRKAKIIGLKQIPEKVL